MLKLLSWWALIFAWSVPTYLSGQAFNPDEKIVDNINPKDVVRWTVNQALRDPQGTVEIGFILNTSQDFSLYQDKLTITPPSTYTLLDMQHPPTELLIDPISDKEVQVFRGGEFLYYFRPTQATKETQEIVFHITYTACTNVICLFPYTERLSVPIHVVAESIILPKSAKSSAPQIKEGSRTGSDLANSLTEQISSGTLALPLLLFLIFLGGVLTNLTPCVYPMIPITLRLLGGQNQKVLLNSSLYAAGILVTYTSLGVFAASTGGMFGALLQNKLVNLFFALVMFTLGFTMLGFGNFSRLQLLGERLGAGKPSLKNMFLMGVGAGFVASPCTGPVLGALLTLTLESQDIKKGILMMFTYSFGFALPYVFLGGLAAKASKVKLAPKWQFLTKLTFAAIMFGLCLYYLRIPLYSHVKELKAYWPITAWSASAISFVLVTIWTLSPRLQMRKELTLIPALFLGISVFAITQALTTTADTELTWIKSEEEAYELAKKSGKPIFVDGWAEWCEACKKMEATTFKDEELVAELNNHWILLKFDLTEDNEANDEIIERYEMPGLPTMVLIPPSGDLNQKHKIVGEKNAVYFMDELKKFRSQF